MSSLSLLRWTLVVVSIIVAAVVGNYFGAARERNLLLGGSSNASGTAAIEKKYEEQLAQIRVQRDIADKSNKALQEKLELAQAELLEQEGTQRLYEKIEGLDESSGLGIDTITRVNDDAGNVSELHVTVVQARGRNRVQGQIGLALVGMKDDTSWREVVFESDANDAPRFDMRFFQTLVVPIPENDILIDFVEIDVKSDSKQHKPFKHDAEWASIFED